MVVGAWVSHVPAVRNLDRTVKIPTLTLIQGSAFSGLVLTQGLEIAESTALVVAPRPFDGTVVGGIIQLSQNTMPSGLPTELFYGAQAAR